MVLLLLFKLHIMNDELRFLYKWCMQSLSYVFKELFLL